MFSLFFFIFDSEFDTYCTYDAYGRYKIVDLELLAFDEHCHFDNSASSEQPAAAGSCWMLAVSQARCWPAAQLAKAFSKVKIKV